MAQRDSLIPWGYRRHRPGLDGDSATTPANGSQPHSHALGHGQSWQSAVPSRLAGPATRQPQWLVLGLVLLGLDALSVWASLHLAYVLRISSGLLDYQAAWDPAIYRTLSLIAVPSWLLWLGLYRLYHRDNLLGGVQEYQKVISGCVAGVLQLIIVSFLWRDLSMLSRGWLVLAWALSCLVLLLERFAVRRIAYRLRRRGWFTDRVLIIGANEQGVAVAAQWSQSRTSGMQPIGFLDDFKPVGTPVLDGLAVLGRPSEVEAMVRQTGASEVVIVANAVAWETFEELVSRNGSPKSYTLRLSPGFYDLVTNGVAVTNKGFVPLFSIHSARLIGVEAVLKWLLDYVVAAPLAVLAMPFLWLTALGLKRSAPGKPVLVPHHTIGRGGHTFTMYKFRSTDPEAIASSDGALLAAAEGPRLENVLYTSGLDKLPQLLHVLAGQMSLVGPRPRVLGEDQTDPHAVRHLQTVKPGIVGPWSVAGHVNSQDELQDELHYVRNWTLWLDLQILVQTTLLPLIAGRWGRSLAVYRDESDARTPRSPNTDANCTPWREQG